MLGPALGRLEARTSLLMKCRGEKTRYPGVYRVDATTHWLRVKTIDPRTGKAREAEKLVYGVSTHEAARVRASLLDEIRKPTDPSRRLRVGEFARSWIESKAL